MRRIEPQLGAIWMSDGNDSVHFVHVAGQLDCFVLGTDQSSPYVFASAGLVSISDEDYPPKSFGGGLGYRMRAGDRLTLRADGRYTRFTQPDDPFGGNDRQNAVAFTLRIGGTFGS